MLSMPDSDSQDSPVPAPRPEDDSLLSHQSFEDIHALCLPMIHAPGKKRSTVLTQLTTL